MGDQFAFLARAKPASLYRLLEKFSLEEAAIALTGLPHALALQIISFYPEERQAPFLPAMREARRADEASRNRVAEKIHRLIADAKTAQGATPGRDLPASPPPAVPAPPPRTVPRAGPPPAPATPPQAVSIPPSRLVIPPRTESWEEAQDTPAPAVPPIAKLPQTGQSVPIGSLARSLAEHLPLPGRKIPDAILKELEAEFTEGEQEAATPPGPGKPPLPAAARQPSPSPTGPGNPYHNPNQAPSGPPPARPASGPVGRPPAGPVRPGLRGGGAQPGAPAAAGPNAGNRTVPPRPAAEPPQANKNHMPGPGPAVGKPGPYQGQTPSSFAEMPPTASVLSGGPAAPAAPAEGEIPAKPASALSELGGKLKGVLKQAHAEISKNLIANSSVAKAAAGKTPAGKAPEPARPQAGRERPARPTPEPRKRPEGPTQWIPRAATSSPINGPPIPGRPESASGDPLASPLAAELLNRIGKAQEKFMPGKAGGGDKPREPAVMGGGAGKGPAVVGVGLGKKPVSPLDAQVVGPVRGLTPAERRRLLEEQEPREGVVGRGKVEMSRTPRMIGQGAKRLRDMPAEGQGGGGGARRVDGKAILAAILREADSGVRDTVRHDDPGLFKELRGRMFFFDDLVLTDDLALAQVFTAVKVEDGALALRFAAPRLRDRVLRVVSPGRARALRESAPSRAGVDAIEGAQERVLGVALRLQSAGRILIDPRDPDLAGE